MKADGSRVFMMSTSRGMAKEAIAALLDQGYTNLWMLDGGTTAWEEAGLALEGKP
jgi:rhodanese-related sulfurtransferase